MGPPPDLLPKNAPMDEETGFSNCGYDGEDEKKPVSKLVHDTAVISLTGLPSTTEAKTVFGADVRKRSSRLRW